jgi:hypothetical protein
MGQRFRAGWWTAGGGVAALVLVVALLLADALWPARMGGGTWMGGPVQMGGAGHTDGTPRTALPASGPCARLNSGQVAYPAHDAGRVTFATAAPTVNPGC